MTLDWLGRFLNIPETLLPFGPGPGGAVIQGSAGEATIVSILGAVAAHEKKMGGTVRLAWLYKLSGGCLLATFDAFTFAVVRSAC